MPRVPAVGLADGLRAVRSADLRSVLGAAFRAAYGALSGERGFWRQTGYCQRAPGATAMCRLGGGSMSEHEVPEVDRTKRCMLSGNPETPEHREIDPTTGMQKDYVVLCPNERAKGFVRPVRRTYRHLTCNTTTSMGLALAETYARDPGFYSGTFCCSCRSHFPLDEFVWEGTNEKLGT